MAVVGPHLALVVPVAIGVMLAWLAWTRRQAPGAVPMVFLALLASTWSLTYAMELASEGVASKILWAKAQYFGIAFTPTAWVAVALSYTGRGHMVRGRNLALLVSIPIATLLLVWTNELHGLIWSQVNSNPAPPPSALELEHGAWWWGFVAYSYGLLFVGTLALSDNVLHTSRLYSRQGGLLLLSVLVPWIAQAMFIAGLQPAGLDPTPFAFTLSGVVLALAILRVRLLDVTPLSRKSVFDAISDGILVVDGRDRIVEYNDVVSTIIGRPESESIGQPLSDVWQEGSFLLKRSKADPRGQQEIVAQMGDRALSYGIIVSRLHDPWGNEIGNVLVFRDITDVLQSALAAAATRLDGLTQRELDVLRLIAGGASNKEIASNLYISPTTVKTHVSNLLRKLDLRDRTQAAEYAVEIGLRDGDGTTDS